MIYSSINSEGIWEAIQLDHYVIGFSEDGRYAPDDTVALCSLQPAHIIPYSAIQSDGKRMLVYDTASMRSLTDAANSFDAEVFLKVLLMLIDTIHSAESEDELDIRKLILDIERIFYDPVSEEIGLVYLPVHVEYGDSSQCMMALRSQMIRFAQMVPAIPAFMRDKICEAFANIINPMTSIQNLIQETLESLDKTTKNGQDSVETEVSHKESETSDMSIFPYGIQLQGFHMGSVICLNISRENFIIGKSAQMSDGVIEASTISRRHCRIFSRDEHYYIDDLNSTNGTWLNDNRLEKDYPQMLHEGDIITISNVSLEVRRLLCSM